MTNYSLDNGLMQPFPRKVIRIFGAIIAAYVMIVFAIDSSLNFLWGVLFSGIGLFSLFIYTKRRRRYYTPLIFTIFYFLGYMLSFSYVLLNKNDVPRSGFGTIGDFMLTDSNFFIVMLAVIAGMGGILTATLIAEKIFRRSRDIATRKNVEPRFLPKKQLYAWILLWGCFSICLALLMWALEIGRTGLFGKTHLPLRFEGLFVYLRGVFVPFCGILLLDICLRGERERPAILILMLLIVIGILGSLGAISRGVFVFTVFPAILFLLFTSRRNNLSQRLFGKFSAITLIVACVVVYFVDIGRIFAFAHVSWGLTNSLHLLTNLESVDFNFKEMIQVFMGLATERIGGIRELMAVIGSNVSDLKIPVKMFMGMISNYGHHSLQYSVLNFVPYSDDTVGLGATFGMWGQLFLSKSYLVVYFGTILLVGIIICFEEVFMRKGLYSVALLFSILLGFQFWGSASMFILSRFTVLLLICYFTVLYVIKRIRKTSPRLASDEYAKHVDGKVR